jgi:cold shock CspA family protein
MERERGWVAAWLETKGYGFIADGRGPDLFFHGSFVTQGTGQAPTAGDGVCFTRQDSPKGPRAVDVVFVAAGR